MKDFGTAVILCGGKSKRMGFDKSMLRVNNKFLVETMGEQLEQVFEKVILVSNDLEKLKAIKYPSIVDIIPELGPMGGIYTALKASDSKYVFVTACDMPRINQEYIRYMMDIIVNHEVDCVISSNSSFLEPLYAFYSVDMLDVFENQIKQNNLGLFDAIRKCRLYCVEEDKVREYSRNMDIFINLNYKKDIAELEENIYGG